MTRLSRKQDGRGRSAEAGARNLARWKAEHPGESSNRHGLFGALGRQVPDEVRALLDRFQTSLEEELGGSPSPLETALIHSARVSYTIILLGQRYLDSEKVEPGSAQERRRKGLVGALRIISNHQAAFLRNLHALGIHKRRVRCDENLDEEVDAVIAEIKAARGVSA
jgi:hypothetical protein